MQVFYEFLDLKFYIRQCIVENIAGLAQLVEHLICNQRVVGSSPTSGTRINTPPVRAFFFFFDGMKKYIIYSCITFLLCGCAKNYVVLNNYSLEQFNDSEVPVCVNTPKRVIQKAAPFIAIDQCGNEFEVPGKYEESERLCDVLEKQVVSYSYCLAQMPKPVHLVEMKDGDMTICYDRNNKVKLPIMYCQKDMNVIQTVSL